MKVDNRIIEAMVNLVSIEEAEIIDRDIWLMPTAEKRERKDYLTKKLCKLIFRNNNSLRVLNSAVRDSMLDNTVYEIFEDYIEKVNTRLRNTADRL